MSEERVRPTWARTFELMCAAIIGAFASKLLETYWPLHDLQSQLIVGTFIVVSLLLISLTLTWAVVWLEKLEKRSK